MYKLLFGVLLAAIVCGLGIWYAAGPALEAEKFPSQSILQLIQSPLPVATTTPASLKIISYNIGFASGEKNNVGEPITREEVEKNLLEMVEALKPLRPDILGLQEVDFFSARTLDINQLEYLSKALKMPYVAYVITWNKRYLPWPYWPPTHHYGRIVSGQAVLSRFPILSQEVEFLKKPRENAFWYNWFYLDRVLQKLTIQLGTQTLKVWHVHLEPFKKATRLEQSQVLAAVVRQDPSPWKIVFGDFNSVSAFRPGLSEAKRKNLEDQGEPLKFFSEETGLKNAEGSVPHYTFPSWDPYKRIDHIFYSPSLKLRVEGTIEGLTASDHLPVWAEFSL